MKRFAIIGVGGYVAPRHLKAIKEVGGDLVAALDKHDSVGVLDQFFPDADFFTEFERFDRHLEKCRRKEGQKVDYVSICSPNYLHDAHVRFALRIDADAICEKPLVLNPWNATALAESEQETGRRISTILQLRYHPAIIALKKRVEQKPPDRVADVELTYVTSRGHWYMESWKGDENKSGGIATNIGIHFFDMLTWIFGAVRRNTVHLRSQRRASGVLELARARVTWFLSLERGDLPEQPKPGELATYRSISVDGEGIDFSGGFMDLHTESYRQILAGNGFGPMEVLPSIEIVSGLRTAAVVAPEGDAHPFLSRV